MKLIQKDYYSSIAEGYNELYEKEQIEKLKVIKEKIGSPKIVLDIGSGTGISRTFFKQVVQIDPSLALLKKSSGMRICGIAESLPLKSKVFDGVISVTSLHHTDINNAVLEIKRVAKPKALFAFSILKHAKNFKEIIITLKNKLKLKEEDSEKDLILFKHTE